MARYHDVPDEMKIQSEMIEPAFQSIIGRLWAQSAYMKTEHGAKSMAHVDALENLWHAATTIQSLSGICIDTHHAKVASANHVRDIGRHIYGELGFFPSFEDENSFRNLTVYDEQEGE